MGPKLLEEADPELEESVPKGLVSELGPSTSHAEAVELTPLIPEWPDVVELAPRMSEFRERSKFPHSLRSLHVLRNLSRSRSGFGQL